MPWSLVAPPLLPRPWLPPPGAGRIGMRVTDGGPAAAWMLSTRLLPTPTSYLNIPLIDPQVDSRTGVGSPKMPQTSRM